MSNDISVLVYCSLAYKTMGFLFYYVFKTLFLGSWIQDPLLSDPNQNSDKSSTSAEKYYAFLLI